MIYKVVALTLLNHSFFVCERFSVRIFPKDKQICKRNHTSLVSDKVMCKDSRTIINGSVRISVR
jgi:hypothetical protein